MKNLYLGCDASKGYADFVIINENHDIIENNFQLDDCFDGHQKLYEVLSKNLQDEEFCLCAGIESTGGYENNWYDLFCRFKEVMDIKAVRLNPITVFHNAKSSMKRVTTDKISALNIANYLIDHKHEVTYDGISYFGPLRRQWMFIKMLKKQKGQILNQLEKLLYSSNPELLQYCKDCVPNYILNLLEKYPTAKKISRAKARSLASIPYITEGKAAEIITAAKSSVASDNSEEIAFLISSIAKQIIMQNKTISIQEKTLEKLTDNEDVAILTSIPGIGNCSAVGLLLEIGTIERFKSSKKLASFFGLHPVFKESGDKIGAMRMSKQGRKVPRTILYMSALTAIRDNEMFQGLYEGYIANGKAKLAAIGIIMHKLLRIIYGVLKNKAVYRASIDVQNREKHSKVQIKKSKEVSSRRFQQFSAKAPISTKQTRKRKQQEKSQDVNNIECGINTPATDNQDNKR